MGFLSKNVQELTVKDIFKISFTIYMCRTINQVLGELAVRHDWFPARQVREHRERYPVSRKN